MSLPPLSSAGQCPVHYRSFPCPVCTSAPNVDPWMYTNPVVPPLVPIPKFGYSFLPTNCEHCFCKEPERVSPYSWKKWTDDTHLVCCNCGIEKLKPVDPGWTPEHHEAFSDD